MEKSRKQSGKQKREKNLMKQERRILWTERDVEALTWIAEQYAVRQDQLQILLGRWSTTPVTKSMVYAVVAGFRRAGWVEAQKISTGVWVWPTRKALRGLGLPYHYKAIDPSETRGLEQMAAINEVRLKLDTGAVIWVCKRDLLWMQSSRRVLPDAEMHGLDEPNVAIKVLLTAHAALSKHLVAHLQAEDSYGDPYSAIWCYAANPSVLGQIQARCIQVPELQIVVEEEACRIVIKGRKKPEVQRSGRRRNRSRQMSAQRTMTPVVTQEDDELTAIFNAVPLASDDNEHPQVGSAQRRQRNHRRLRSRREA